MKKILSGILAVVLLLGTLSIQVSAALDPIYAVDANGATTNMIDYKKTVEQYLSSDIRTEEEKLKKMTLRYEKSGYQLWADEFTGEVAYVDLESGQMMFTNPTDVASSTAAHHDTTRYELMSQLIVKFTDNGTEKYFNSFEQAAMNGQIDVKNIKNGLRVEYTIGREDTKYLVPRLIEKERMEQNILHVVAQAIAEEKGVTADEVINNPYNSAFFKYGKIKSYYTLKDPNNVKSDRELSEMQSQFEITKKQYKGQLMAVYIASAKTSQELREVETIIKTYCPLYTYEQLEADHALTEYSKEDRAPALFKMALEYRLDDMGLTVRLPANGIRFNEAEYKLSDISILPWMGAGSNLNTGYTFFPDGSGALFRFEDLNNKKTHTLSGSIYGQDYAYHTVTGTHQEIIRYPVFGIVENKPAPKLPSDAEDAPSGETTPAPEGGEGQNPETTPEGEETEKVKDTLDRGFVAILEQGDALAKLALKHYGAVSKYNSVYVVVNPRPRDEYILSDAVSVGSNNSVTVVSKRKYVGDYKIRYMLLTDKDVAKEKEIPEFYEATWLGMATAYRTYLTSPYSTGTQNLPKDQQYTVLNRLTADQVKEDIPLYIETFGSVETVKKVLSIPVNVKVALTSFEDIQNMYSGYEDEDGNKVPGLAEAGITNVNFKLTGYYNGGMYSSVPYRLKFEKSVGGKKGFKDLIADAKDKGYGVYVDFNFAYATSNATKMFDGLKNQRDLVKAIDDRYTSKQYYSVTRQSYTSYFELAISPSRFEYFYDKVSATYLDYNPIGISLSTLASHLNSDFDEEEPYNRNDSKEFTEDLFKKIRHDYSNVMADSANSYTWAYIDHMVNAAVDSSRYVKASNSVPFLGVVLHGFIQFAGTPMNMEGNIGHAMLKAIENGSGIYFILSLNNTEILKEDQKLSQYYSVRYDIWFDELVERYKSVNSVLKDVQTKLIIDHKFLIGERIPDKDELDADKQAEADRIEEEKKKAEEQARIEYINAVRFGRYEALTVSLNNQIKAKEIYDKFITNGGLDDLKLAIDKVTAPDDEGVSLLDKILAKRLEVAEAKKAYDDATKEFNKIKRPTKEDKEHLNEIKNEYVAKKNALSKLEKDDLIKDLTSKHSVFEGQIPNLQRFIDMAELAMTNVGLADKELHNGNYSEAVEKDIEEKVILVNEACKDIIDNANKVINAYNTPEIYGVLQKIYPKLNIIKTETEQEEDKDKEDEKDKNDEYEYTKYTNSDGNIVAVTYGGKNGVDLDPYKTFILNYNFFSVKVNYNGTEYEIPAFGYVIINH